MRVINKSMKNTAFSMIFNDFSYVSLELHRNRDFQKHDFVILFTIRVQFQIAKTIQNPVTFTKNQGFGSLAYADPPLESLESLESACGGGLGALVCPQYGWCPQCPQCPWTPPQFPSDSTCICSALRSSLSNLSFHPFICP